MTLIHLLATVVLGLCLGSFATALSYRLPRGISMTAKAHSACPSCGNDLGVRDLVPLFSWLLRGGRCRFCEAKISRRYPLIELGTLLLCLAFYAVYGFTPQGFVLFALAPVLAAIVAIDLEHGIIPDKLNLAVLGLGVLAFLLGPSGVEEAGLTVGGMLAYAGAAWLLRRVFMAVMKREPMGLGDVKFFGAAGFWLSLDAEAAAAFMLISGVSGIALGVLWKRLSGHEEFPFGPALVLALAAMIVWSRPFTQ